MQAALASANSAATETLGAMRTVILCGCEGSELGRYTQSVDTYYALSVKQTAMQVRALRPFWVAPSALSRGDRHGR